MLELAEESQSTGDSPTESTDDPWNQWFLFDLVLEVVRNIACRYIPGLSSHFDRLNKVEQSIVSGFSSDVRKHFDVSV